MNGIKICRRVDDLKWIEYGWMDGWIDGGVGDDDKVVEWNDGNTCQSVITTRSFVSGTGTSTSLASNESRRCLRAVIYPERDPICLPSVVFRRCVALRSLSMRCFLLACFFVFVSVPRSLVRCWTIFKNLRTLKNINTVFQVDYTNSYISYKANF